MRAFAALWILGVAAIIFSALLVLVNPTQAVPMQHSYIGVSDCNNYIASSQTFDLNAESAAKQQNLGALRHLESEMRQIQADRRELASKHALLEWAKQEQKIRQPQKSACSGP